MHSPSISMSAVPKPRVVAAETPRRSPVHLEGLRASNGTGFLFDVTPARASAVSACWPRIPTEARSRSTMWVSVPAAHNPDPTVCERGSERARIFDDAPPVVPELRAKGLAQADRLGGEDIGVKAPLYPGEHRGLKAPGERIRARQDEPTPGPAQGLGRGTGDDVGVRERRGVHAGGDEPCDMGHVDQQSCFDGFGDPCHAFEVNRAWIGGAAGDQQRRSHLAGPGLDLVVVEQAARAVHAVVMGVEPAPGEVRSGAVTEVTDRRGVETQDPVSGSQQHEEHRLVCLRARMRLHVGIGGAEKVPCALDSEAFDDVDVLAAAVEAVSGIALQRLVADLVSKRLAHRAAHDVLRGNELNLDALAARLVVERLAHRRIGLGEGTRDVGEGVVTVAQSAFQPIPFGTRRSISARPGLRVTRGFTGRRPPAPRGTYPDGAPDGGPLTGGMAYRGEHGPGCRLSFSWDPECPSIHSRAPAPSRFRSDHAAAPVCPPRRFGATVRTA